MRLKFHRPWTRRRVWRKRNWAMAKSAVVEVVEVVEGVEGVEVVAGVEGVGGGC